MTDVPTPAVPDLARIPGSSVSEAVAWLIAYYDVRVPWNYRVGTRCVKTAYAGLHNLEQLMAGCDSEKIKQSRVSNREIVKLAAPRAFGRSTQVFNLKSQRFPFGQNRFAAYRVPFFFVEGGVVKLYFLQPRKGTSPTYDQLCMVATIHKRFLLDTEFYGEPADLEYVDLSENPKEPERRAVNCYSLASLELWSEERLRDRLTLISEALDEVAKAGVVKPRRRGSRPEADMPLFD